MIQITDKKECCGCYGCHNVCPKKCISMQIDQEGFAYPLVDTSLCIDCGLCEKVCPVINRFDQRDRASIEVSACKSLIEPERLQSSSGGVFSLLATQTLNDGGVVFAASFDEKFDVRHSACRLVEDLPKYRGSKYIPSHIGSCYTEAQTELKTGREVMFVGTHCQIAGLKHLLRKEYDNLLAVEIICHGVPSPVVFGKYLREATSGGDIKSISFRDKSGGWARYRLNIEYELDGRQQQLLQPAYANPYMRGFIKGLYLRPSCYSCPAKNFVSGADMTLADYWGVHTLNTDINDDKGVSMVLTYTDKGRKAFKTIGDKMDVRPSTIENAVTNNPAIKESVADNPVRHKFFTHLAHHTFASTAKKFIKPVNKDASIMQRIGWKIQAFRNRFL